MQKLAIQTIIDYTNYGNRLQNYATQEILKQLGFYVETIVNKAKEGKRENRKSIKNKVQNIINKPIGEIYTKTYMKLWKYKYKNKINEYKIKRLKAFKDFTVKYIKETDFSISENNIPENLSSKYDYFVTGSDQVWNPLYRQGSSLDFLTYAPKNKRIAYAPSFGISEIPIEYLEKYKIWLSEMKSLSVRENTGAKIIKDLTGRNAEVLVDPTLMLSKEKWLSISKPSSNKPESKYLLTYFLGGISNENMKKILSIAKKNNLEVVNLADIKNFDAYVADPSEFIDYINSASVVFTDSFHGSVFSIIMETPFVVFYRLGNTPSIHSRIDTLLSTFKLESRLVKNITSNNQIFDIEFTDIPLILKKEQKKALDYLECALKIKNPIK